MKKFFIITLVVLILLLGAAWVYLLIHGAPKSIADIAKNFFGNSTSVTVTPTTSSQPVHTETQNDAPGERTIGVHAELVKLTDKPVAGAVVVTRFDASSTASTTAMKGNVIRYVLKGTGHVYEISLDTGIEKRISNRMIPQVVEAIWSPSGINAVLTTDKEGYRGDTLLATLSSKDSGMVLDTEVLPSIANAAFSSNGESLFYTQENTEGGISGFSRTLKTGTSQQLFSIPFKEAVVLWDIWEKTTQYVYTKPAPGFMGYLYQIDPKGLKKIDGEQNLTATRLSAETLIVSGGSGLQTILLDSKKNSSRLISTRTLKEKCAGTNERFWCGTSEDTRNDTFPTAWYQGIVQYADSLWSIDSITGRSQKVMDPEAVAREQIDMTDMQFGANVLLFRNKKDDSLWLYNLIH